MSKPNKLALWGYSLVAGAISGSAGAGLAWIGTAAANAAGADVKMLNLKQFGIVLVAGAIPSVLAYLKQSPLPPLTTETESTITVTTTEHTVTPDPTPTEPKP